MKSKYSQGPSKMYNSCIKICAAINVRGSLNPLTQQQIIMKLSKKFYLTDCFATIIFATFYIAWLHCCSILEGFR
jgi:hypothetical protein